MDLSLRWNFSLLSVSLFPFRSKPFQWTEKHDILLCRKILVCEPFYLKPRSPERGKTWEKIARNLNMLHDPKFRVTSRSVRDRCTLLTTKHAQKLRDEERTSGIAVEETELDSLLEDILEKEKLGKEQIELDTEKKKTKADKQKLTATSIREEAMKRMTKQSRKGSESDDPDDDEEEEEESCDKAPLRRKKRVRRSVNDAIGYLQEKAEKDYSLKMEEMNLRKKELETAAERDKAKAEHQEKISQQQQETLITMLKQMQQQQQNQQNLQAMLIAQQQQQNQILMALMDKSGEKLS